MPATPRTSAGAGRAEAPTGRLGVPHKGGGRRVQLLLVVGGHVHLLVVEQWSFLEGGRRGERERPHEALLCTYMCVYMDWIHETKHIVNRVHSPSIHPHH